jgi:hypothetical protein
MIRSHLKNAKWLDLHASCCSAEIVFQQESSFQQNSRPLRAGGLTSNHFSIFEITSIDILIIK